ncbi:unnamed protein product [Linum tenue]|uniref:Uncharacterized protein n=2 Tax=Linum tenue TaxID=586396 RepID=A0AAV0R559_9ROSI|nr:unnamed protein product [Linum tenue]
MAASLPLPLCALLLLLSSIFVLSHAAAYEMATLEGVDLGNPRRIHFSSQYGHSPGRDPKEALFCERVKISGQSRLKLASYSSALRVTLVPFPVISERLHRRIHVCFHRNASLGRCDCEKEEWKTFQNAQWSSVMSPYQERYIDVKTTGGISGGGITVQLKEESQRWRLLCLAVGFILLLLAPIVSSWVPFYYSTSMAIGIFLVIIILLFQVCCNLNYLGMKLLPTGRKSVLYLSIYGSVVSLLNFWLQLGVGTFILHHISELINSILLNFGLDEEMHNPVYIFVLVGIVLAGAGLGYWMVRKFVVAKDGSVDRGVAEFVKWAIRAIATTFIFQSTPDPPLALLAVVLTYTICSLIIKWMRQPRYKSGRAVGKQSRAEFYSRSATATAKMSPGGRMPGAWMNSPVKGLVTSSSAAPAQHGSTVMDQDYYSTFHKTAKRKKFTKEEWDEFTRESTKEAMREWASSPEVASWLINNADRIQLLPSDCSSDEEASGKDSETDSTEENASSIQGGKGLSCLFSW